jgi:hypothetical protein
LLSGAAGVDAWCVARADRRRTQTVAPSRPDALGSRARFDPHPLPTNGCRHCCPSSS